MLHKSKLHHYRELKREAGFEEYLEYVEGAYARLFFKFRSGTQGLFKELGKYVGRDGSQECRNCAALKIQLSMFCFSVQHMIPREKYL